MSPTMSHNPKKFCVTFLRELRLFIFPKIFVKVLH